MHINFMDDFVIAINKRNFTISEALPVDKIGSNPLCMIQYTKMFYSCRIPGKTTDSTGHFPPPPEQPDYIVVVHNNQVNVNLYIQRFIFKYYEYNIFNGNK